MEKIIDKRKGMVEYALEHGVTCAAEKFNTTRKTVGKWRDRYFKDGLSGLQNRSTAPKEIPHKISLELEKKILTIKRMHPELSANRIKNQFGIPVCLSTMYRVLTQQNGTASQDGVSSQQREIEKAMACSSQD